MHTLHNWRYRLQWSNVIFIGIEKQKYCVTYFIVIFTFCDGLKGKPAISPGYACNWGNWNGPGQARVKINLGSASYIYSEKYYWPFSPIYFKYSKAKIVSANFYMKIVISTAHLVWGHSTEFSLRLSWCIRRRLNF